MEYLVYNDKLWKPYMTFNYVGHPEEFTLQPDTYLFVANGARGGITKNPFISWGGTTYGILDLDHEQTMYAVVGGNGEDPRNKTSKTADVINVRAKGGYNGGGEGGLAWSPNTYDNGAAGGGATDVRLAHPSFKSIPDEYDQIEYIEANGTQYIDLNYFFNTNISKFEMVVDLRDPTTIPDGEKDMVLCGSRDSSNNMIVMYRVDYSNIAQYGVGSNWLRGSSFPFGTKFRIVVTGQRLFAWYDMNGTQLGSISMENYSFTMTRSAYVFKYQNSDGSYDRKTYGKLYSFKIYENGTLKRYYIPFKSKPDAETQTSGLYDIINGVAYTSPIGDPFVCGNVVEKTVYRDDYDEHSLLTRFFVAGGGGGSCNMYNQDYVQDFLSFGGGARSGWVACYDAGSEHNIWKSATQDSGFSFCYGAAAQNRSYGGTTWGYEGQAGGGGGWYGGYAVINRQSASIAYSACNGSGGSSYVLTADSYKPEHYMESFEDVMPTLYFRDFLMLPYQAFNGPSLVIYKEAHGIKSVGDVIRVPYTGREEVIKLIPGSYRVKCYGGDGAVRFRNRQASKGGYAEGVLTLPTKMPLYWHVGNSSYLIGMGTNAANHDAIFNNRMVYQSSVSNYSNYLYGAMSGGGSVDVRLEPVRYDSVIRKIPDGYDQVEYIKSDDSQCIKTTYVPKSTSNIECVVEIYRHSGWETLFGARTAVQNTQFDLYTGMDGQDKMFFESGNSGTTSSFTMPYNQKIKITVIGNVVTLYDMEDNVLGSITGNARVNTSYPLYIFDVCTGGNVYGAYSEAKIYYFKITEGSDVARYFVPFVNQGDSTDSGLYDLVTQTFHRRTGGSAFTLGEVVEKESYTLNIDNTVNSRLSRIIVAGGGGGQGANGKYGGAGGGTSGNSYTGGGYGSNNGPGTQNSGYAFEVGGTGSAYSSGYGGSGGYGWYGGCGTAPDGSGDDDKAGCGGSGYVLTADSYKPTGYIPDERFYLTNTVLTTGGNPVRGMTRIVVEPIAIKATTAIAHDTEGYKGYDNTTNEWYLLPSQVLSEELFDEYGATDSDIATDTGLLFPYTLLVFDKYEVGVNNITNHILPTPQTVSFSVKTTAEILGETYDYDADENTTIDINYNITGIAENRSVNISATFDMIDTPNMNPSLYMVQFQTRNKPSSYYYPIPPEKTIDDLDLLYVGHNVKIPSRYKPSIGGFMPDGTTAITTVGSSSSCQYKRNIYTATLINNTYLRFTRFSLIENKSYVIRDIPIAGIPSFSGRCVGGSLLVDDDNMYLYHSMIKNSSNQWIYTRVLVVPLDPSKTYSSYVPSESTIDVCCNAFGQAYWYSSNKIITCSVYGFLLFNTITHTFTKYNDSETNGGARLSFALGDHSILSFWNDDTCTGPRVYNRSTITRISSGFSLTMPAGKKCACYADGNFYVAQKGHIYVINDREDHALVINKDISAPFSTIQPKTIDYSDGVLYITFVNQTTVYIYNLNTETFFSMSLPFGTGDVELTGLSWYRPATYKGFFFIEHLKLFVTNALQAYKYRIGQKGNQLVIPFNSENEDKMTYDSRFVTVDNMGTTAHTGYIDKSLTEIDTTNHIFESEPYIRDDYRKFISLQIQSGEEE